MTALWPLQVALVTRLLATSGVTALVGQRVYDGQAPQGAALPYVVVGEGTSVPMDVFGRRGVEETVTLHVWSRYSGRKEALEIVAAIDVALATPLVITGWGTAHLRPDFVTTLVDPSGHRHVPARYRVTTLAA